MYINFTKKIIKINFITRVLYVDTFKKIEQYEYFDNLVLGARQIQ